MKLFCLIMVGFSMLGVSCVCSFCLFEWCSYIEV